MLKIGLILFSVRDEMKKDPLGTIEKVGQIGYRFVELCNHNAVADPGCGFGVPAKDLRETMDRMGVRAVSAHIGQLEKADLDAVIAYHQAVGNPNLVIAMNGCPTYDEMMQKIEFIQRTGVYLKERGMNLVYHNHHEEFRTYNGKTVLDHILDNSDPDILGLEMDTFWVMRAGLNPVDMIKKYGKRICLLHQKDFAWDALAPINLIGISEEERMGKPEVGNDGSWSDYVEIGDGIMHIQEIIDAAIEYTNAEYMFLEQDFTRMKTQIDSIARSMESFRKFNNIIWND